MMKKFIGLFIVLCLLNLFSGISISGGGADTAEFPDIYIDEGVGGTHVGSIANPYDDLSDINWTTGGDNSIFDWYAGAEDASVTINLLEGDTWREKMTIGASGSATYPIIIRGYGDDVDPKILRSVAKNATGDWTLERYTGAILHESYFEGGDLSEWDTEVEVGGSTVTAHADAAYLGDFGAKFVIAADDDVHLTEDNAFADQAETYCRFYINFNNLTMGDEDVFNIYEGRDDANNTRIQLSINYEATGTHYYLYVKILDDTSTTIFAPGSQESGWLCDSIIDGNWHCIEVHFKAGTGADGEIEFWVDGTERGSKTDCDIDDIGIGRTRIGARSVEAGTSGTIYIDDVITDTTAIGQNRLWYTASATQVHNLIYDSEASEATMETTKAALTANGEGWWDAGNTRIYVYDLEENPATTYSGSIELALKDYAIDMNDKAYITIDGLDFRYVGDNAIHLEYSAAGSDITIQNCNFKYIGSNLSGSAHFNGRSIFVTDYNNTTVDNCTFDYIWFCMAMFSPLGDGMNGYVVTITDNTIGPHFHGYGDNTDAINFVDDHGDYVGSVISGNDISGWFDDAIDLRHASNVIVRNNLIHDPAAGDGTGVGLGIKAGGTDGDGTSTGNQILRNSIYNITEGTTQQAINSNGAEDIIVAYNLIYNVGDRGINITSGVEGWEVYNNVIYGCGTWGIYVGDNTALCTIRNNIFRNNTTADLIVGAPTTVTGGFNCLEDAAIANPASYNGSANDLYLTDPLFVDVASDDFRLLMASPCINAGTDVGLTRDYRGRSIRHAPDIGAYEDPTNAIFMAAELLSFSNLWLLWNDKLKGLAWWEEIGVYLKEEK